MAITGNNEIVSDWPTWKTDHLKTTDVGTQQGTGNWFEGLFGLGQGKGQGQVPGIGQQGMSGLAGTMQGVGSIAGGLSDLGGLYLAYQQGEQAKKMWSDQKQMYSDSVAKEQARYDTQRGDRAAYMGGRDSGKVL